MTNKISESTQVTLDLKTIGIIVGGAISLASVYFALQSDIQLAKELPKPPIDRTEYDLKDQLVRETIININENNISTEEEIKYIYSGVSINHRDITALTNDHSKNSIKKKDLPNVDGKRIQEKNTFYQINGTFSSASTSCNNGK